MATEAQFNFMDGGERCPNNLAYYAMLGLSVGSIQHANGKYFFVNPNDYGPSPMVWSPPAFSSKSVYLGTRLMVAVWGTNIQVVNGAGQAQIVLTFNADGSITATAGATTLGSTLPGLIQLNTICYLEVKVVIDAAAGVCVLQLNGNPAPILDIAAADTAPNAGNLPATSIVYTGAAFSNDIYIRDMYIHDGTGAAPFNGFLGNGGAEYLPPIANVSTGFTPNGNASNYQNAAETSPNPTVDYNSSSAVGQADVFTITPLPNNVNSVIAVKTFDYSYKNDTGARALQKKIISAGITVQGAENYLNETATVTEDMYIADPATGAAFLPAAVNALEIGYTVAA